MFRKSWLIAFVLMLSLLGLVVATTAQEPAPRAPTYITVTSTDDDYTDGYSTKCSDVPANECTLRRAINQAYPLSSANRPVYIQFNIPTNDPGYNASIQAWKIQLTGSSAYDLRELYGLTILDGSTQTGGRPDGPKIILDGQGNHNYGFILRQNDNEVRGLAMQNFQTAHISLSSDGNTVEDCWFGLSDDGTTLSSGDDEIPEGGSGLSVAAGSDNNTIQNNVFAGFFGVAAAIRSNNNVFAGNWVGTRADGTVPIPHQFDQHPCLSGAWTGGSGITVDGNNHQIGGPTPAEGNVFAGLFLDVGPVTTQRPTMDVIGSGHLIQNNIMGLDVNDSLVGICGRGLDFGGGPHDMQVLDNVIAQPGLSAILMNSFTLNGNTLQGNIIWRAQKWPGEQGLNPFPEDAIALGPTVPAALKSFEPAKVLQVNGTAVSGTSGDGSLCPYCTIEIFLDDTDTVTEALQSLAMVTANAGGSWNATLPAPLESGQGLRTMSTVPDNFTITGLDDGTTSKLSKLQAAIYQVFLPVAFKND